ncbi:MAG TPA: hypothetical protein VN025_18040 [Candidatus Dormibacteraeota bacterium]|jgi:hypothetical protein|nr:hypothetical protein [Candidatus Dormibacteraeota bacterium]
MKRVFSHPLIALTLGLWLRLFFILKYPATSGDTALYEDLATNWLKHHAYAMTLDAGITPVDVRMPGYPAFLMLIYALSGHVGEVARIWVMLSQVAVDIITCAFVAMLASLLLVIADSTARVMPVLKAAFWIALLCPFTANYSAVLLTEVFGVCFSAIALILLVGWTGSCWEVIFPAKQEPWEWPNKPEYWAALAGLAVGATTLFRPESPLLLIGGWVGGGWLMLKHGRFLHWLKLVIISGAMCAVALAPWAIRNAISLHELQFLAPKDTNLPSEHPPYGFMAWEKTWLFRMSDCYAVTWKLDEEIINLADIPSRAFDSDEEKSRVAAILEKYNKDQNLTPEQDAAFREIAKERTARHPLRTYLWVPLQRAITIWFTPRIELLPFSGNVFPLAQNWSDDRMDQSVTAGFFLLNIVYLGLALIGFCRLWIWNKKVRPALICIASYLLLRTAFLTTVEAPEPRYVLVCYPAILALCATLFGKSFRPDVAPE